MSAELGKHQGEKDGKTTECLFLWADDTNLAKGASAEKMTWWEEGFDRTRFCRSDSHTYKTPTCCNFMQDTSIRDEIAKFLPEQCLNSEKFQMDVIPYTDILKEIFCTPCTAYEKDKRPKYLPPNVQDPDAVTLNVCKSAASQLWLLTDQVDPVPAVG